MKATPVFSPSVLQSLADKHKAAFQQLGAIEGALSRLFVHMDHAIRALVLAAASGEALLFIGPPGTAKSQLIRVFCDHLGIPASDTTKPRPEGYFEYLLTQFTEPGELFGYYDVIAAQKEQKLKRVDEGMLQKAHVIYLDEVFNASSAILNSLLSVMQEKRFHDGKGWINAPWQCFFGATNHLPTTDVLQAFFDRFLLRCWVENVETGPDLQGGVSQVRQLLATGWNLTYGYQPPAALRRTSSNQYRQSGPPGLLADLQSFQSEVKRYVRNGRLKVNPESVFHQNLTLLANTVRDAELSEVSNRRLVKIVYVMMVHAIYEAVRDDRPISNISIGSRELELLWSYGLDRQDAYSKQKFDLAVGRSRE